MPRAMRWTCSSVSMTQGPAIQTRRPAEKALYLIGTRVLRLRFARGEICGDTALAVLVRRADEGLEQGMRLHGLGLELGMELAAEKPRVIGDLADLDVGAVRGLSRDAQAR